MQPGQTISPGGQTSEPKVTEVEVSLHGDNQPQQPNPSPASQPEVSVPTPEQPIEGLQTSPDHNQPTEESKPEPESTWQYATEDQTPQPNAPRLDIVPVSWTASEYVAHQKSPSWYMAIGGALLALLALVYLLTRDVIASVMVAVAGVIFAAFSARPPRVLEYAVNEQGIQIGQRFYAYHDFKSFAINQDGPLPSILLMPLKRFLPPITVFYDPQSEDAILNVLSSYLPLENKQPDAVDKLMSRIRF